MTEDRKGVNTMDPPPGLINRGVIVGTVPSANPNAGPGAFDYAVQIKGAPAIKGKPRSITIPAAFPYSDSSGLFIGSIPAKNTPITLTQELGGQYHFVSFEPENKSAVRLPNMKPGQLLLHSTDDSEITLDLNGNINIGSVKNSIHIFTGSQKRPDLNLISMNFESSHSFTQAYREVGGIVKRDFKPNPQAASRSGSTKLEDDFYKMFNIGFDPTVTANDITTGPNKNPPFTEHREVVYEFQYNSDVEDDVTESNKYSTVVKTLSPNVTPNRRSSRADILSLSLVAPNYLLEQVKGTVVDIFGNILDINRLPLPVGLSATATLQSTGTVATTNAQQSYINIRALERKSIAYHFEINARKDPNDGDVVSTINNQDYNSKLLRSRFFFDVDKEGQFKLNVPASSETGNVPLLVRPENYSTFGTTGTSDASVGDPNQLWFIQTGQPVSQDVFVDSFASPKTKPDPNAAGFAPTFPRGSVTLKDGTSGNDIGPVDRISYFHDKQAFNIKHGTAYHDVLQTANYSRTSSDMMSWITGAVDSPDISYLNNDAATSPAPVKDSITVSGTGANAGGRSGQLNFDGSIEMNIGANTSDKQSMWLDTAGGIVGNLGRDLNQRSLMLNADGNIFIQIGGPGLGGDSRFASLAPDVPIPGVLDIRVFVGGFSHLIRVDSKGMLLMSPGRIGIHAGQGMTLTSDGDLEIDAETVTIQQRAVKKVFGGSI